MTEPIHLALLQKLVTILKECKCEDIVGSLQKSKCITYCGWDIKDWKDISTAIVLLSHWQKLFGTFLLGMDI